MKSNLFENWGLPSITEGHSMQSFIEEADVDDDFRRILQFGYDNNELTDEQVEGLVKKYKETSLAKHNPEEIEEDNVAANVAPTATPHAFDPGKKEPKVMKRESMTENIERKLAQRIDEIGYKDFSSVSKGGRVNSAIKEVNQKLKGIEKTLSHTVRLKEESGIGKEKLTTEAQRNLRRIKERLYNVIEGIKRLES